MTYLECAEEIYCKFQSTDFKKIFKIVPRDPIKISETLDKYFKLDNLRKAFYGEVQITVDKYLPFYKEELTIILKAEEINAYLLGSPARIMLFLFWIWEHKINLPDITFNKLVNALFCGTFGYKMIDYGMDNVGSNSELVLVGFYSIRTAERLLSESLGTEHTATPIHNYFAKYIEVELLEKQNRWKECPFSWNEPQRLGQKASPLGLVYESLFRKVGYSTVKIRSLMKALTLSWAVVQIIDDLQDLKKDLTNGYETLVVKDFYKTFGTDSIVTEEKINQIITEERLRLIYQTGQKLINNARKILEKYDENILQYHLEMQHLIFNSLFEITY
jgi:hypothetical protein